MRYSRDCVEGDSYKIGITDFPTKRRLQHEQTLDGLVDTLSFTAHLLQNPRDAAMLEHQYTVVHIANYGFDKVRGSCYDYPDQNGRIVTNYKDGTRRLDRSYRRKKVIREAHDAVATCLNLCYNCHGPHLRSYCDAVDVPRNSHYRYFRKNGVPQSVEVVDPTEFILPYTTRYAVAKQKEQHARDRAKVSRVLRRLATSRGTANRHGYNLRPRTSSRGIVKRRGGGA